MTIKINEKYKQEILELLKKATEPMDVAKIRYACHIGNWNTAMKHCLELMLDRKINGQRTSKGWIFWPKQEAKTNERG
jgi:hypothetical protein